MPTTIRIKQPLWGASKLFHWNEHQPGWGIAIDKLQEIAQRGENKVTLEIKGTGYTVPITGLIREFDQWKGFNQNGSHYCGYLPLPVIQELASSDAQPNKTGEGGH